MQKLIFFGPKVVPIVKLDPRMQVDSPDHRGLRRSRGHLPLPPRQRRGREFRHRPGPLGAALRLLQEPRRRRQAAPRPTRGHQPPRQVWQLSVTPGIQHWPCQVSILRLLLINQLNFHYLLPLPSESSACFFNIRTSWT